MCLECIGCASTLWELFSGQWSRQLSDPATLYIGSLRRKDPSEQRRLWDRRLIHFVCFASIAFKCHNLPQICHVQSVRQQILIDIRGPGSCERRNVCVYPTTTAPIPCYVAASTVLSCHIQYDIKASKVFEAPPIESLLYCYWELIPVDT